MSARRPKPWCRSAGPWPGMAVAAWLPRRWDLRQGQAPELQLQGSSHRRGPALAVAALQSCLAAPHSHRREGGAALSWAISKLALSPAAKSPGGGCNQGPYSHLRSQGAAAFFSLLHRKAWEQMVATLTLQI